MANFMRGSQAHLLVSALKRGATIVLIGHKAANAVELGVKSDGCSFIE
jgi:hypothetical protein